jgi:hypothetical protein
MVESVITIGWISLSIITILAFCTLVYVMWKGGKKLIESFFSGLVASCLLAIFGILLFPRVEWLQTIEQAIGLTSIVIGIFAYPFGIAVRFGVRGALRWYRKVIT